MAEIVYNLLLPNLRCLSAVTTKAPCSWYYTVHGSDSMWGTDYIATQI